MVETNYLQPIIRKKFDYLRDFVLEKNRKYGDSALKPVRIFSKADTGQGILVRLDDKMSRLMKGDMPLDHELIRDIIGYLVLYDVYLDESKIKYEKNNKD